MRTIYLRNVPDTVGDGLDELARRESLSLNAFVVRELAEVARRAHNARLLQGLPDLGISNAEILAAVDEGRNER